MAPTGEVLAALAAIEGDVKNIVLPSISPEHWYFGPAMAAAFPDATVWVAPGEGLGLRGGPQVLMNPSGLMRTYFPGSFLPLAALNTLVMLH